MTLLLSARQTDPSSLARQALAAYHEADRDTELANRIPLQLAAGDWAGALRDIAALRALRMAIHPARAPYADLPHELYALARQREAQGAVFDAAFREALVDRLARLDDRGAFQAEWTFGVDLAGLRRELQATPAQPRTMADQVARIRAQETLAVFEQVLPLARPLLDADDARRYLVEERVIPTEGGASVSAVIVRPRSASRPLPAAFEFTIYANPSNLEDAKRSAAHGFAGVTATSRGKRGGAGAIEPYEHDGADADAVIGWIAAQPWSDGQVGMFGGSYNGFTQWAAAKHPPKALKSLMPCVAVAPGIDVPMQGGIFQNFQYSWIPYVTNGKVDDDAAYGDFQRWNGLDWAWFGGTRPYRDLPSLDGHPNPIFERWLDHPAYDAYWQAMIPFREEFARIRIPVLETTGYFDGAQLGALYYFQQHAAYAPSAEQYLVVGPYDHLSGQHRSQEVVAGYRIDPAARLDVEELRYQWLDYTLRGGPKPGILQDRVNYEVMGADRWRHAPSVEAMAPEAWALHVTPLKAEDAFLLAPGPAKGGLDLRVELGDRRVLSFGGAPPQALAPTLDSDNGFAFATEVLKAPVEVEGLFSGELRVTTNKRDFDFDVELYEQTPKGDYLLLSYLTARASFLKDRTRRRLLRPGRAEVLAFRSGRLAAAKVEAGGRLVVVFKILKNPRMELDYGTGGDVGRETPADGKVPLELHLDAASFIRIPIRAGDQG
ncbi:MAG TPA: CocE/NonD family hydrolase [Holophagaceae bacterium]|nr:CocE/NonD family hydrolase [Holophagaceae bacterium]